MWPRSLTASHPSAPFPRKGGRCAAPSSKRSCEPLDQRGKGARGSVRGGGDPAVHAMRKADDALLARGFVDHHPDQCAFRRQHFDQPRRRRLDQAVNEDAIERATHGALSQAVGEDDLDIVDPERREPL